jgi:hypothetical protein
MPCCVFIRKPTVSRNPEQALNLLYQRMSIAQLQQRIASGELTSDARQIVGSHLQCKLSGNSREARAIRDRQARDRRRRLDPHFVPVPMWLLGQAAVAILLMAMLPKIYWPYGILAWIFGTILMARIVGKAFPKLARALGWLTLLSPVYALMSFLFMAHYLAPGPLLLSMIGILILSIVPCTIGYNLIKGSAHKGSWEELEKELAKERADYFASIAENRRNS